MALLPNSSLHNWISFDETTWNNASFPPCQHVNWSFPDGDETHLVRHITNASCTKVCNNSVSLFGWQENLATCGLWSTLVYAYYYEGSGPDPSRYTERAPVDLLSSFADVGLDANDPEYFQSAVGYADIMSTCFAYLYQMTRRDDGSVSGSCTKNWLFPYSPWSSMVSPNRSADANFNQSATTLSICLAEICSPVALNPELAGVGFVISFVLQSVVAILAFPVLFGLETLHWSNKVTFAALVSFHKAQCYFSSTVQIAALIGIIRNTGSVYDTSALIVLTTSGFIPVSFGFASITHFGRPSWHLIILSLFTFALATATLGVFYNYDLQWGQFEDYFSSVQKYAWDGYGACAIEGHMSDTLFPLCGSSLLNSNAIPSSTVTDKWVWVAWVTCIAWMLWCFYSKPEDGKPPTIIRSWLDRCTTRYPWMQRPRETMGRLPVFIVSSLLCFGVQFYLISVFHRHHLVSQVWTFGQIVAVTVWIPSIFEVLHDVLIDSENSLTRGYPSPLIVMKGMVQQTVKMANISLIEGSNYATLSDSDAEAVPLQGLGSTVDGHSTGQTVNSKRW